MHDRAESDAGRSGLLRGAGADAHRVTFFELFFDLVYVFAITQLSSGLLDDLSLAGALHTGMLLLAVWWAWVYTAWATNWLDPERRPVRLMLIGVMALALVMAAALPQAFGERGLVFAVAYGAIQVGRSAFVLYCFRNHPVQRRNFQRIVTWNAAASLVWIAGGLADGSARELIWMAALAVDYAAPAAAFWVPGLGRSATSDWTVTGSHFAERFKLFVILALGESILVTGITLSHLPITAPVAAGFAVAFVGSVALWWIYFDRAAEAGSSVLQRAIDPGRMARSAYTYFHLPIVAGIIVIAVADEMMIEHPEGLADAATVAVTLAGPALFLIGHALYKWASFGVISAPRLLAVGALVALTPVASFLSPLALGAAATSIVVLVAAWDTVLHPETRASAAAEAPDQIGS
jgi:low temperature requirement protein LtrA